MSPEFATFAGESVTSAIFIGLVLVARFLINRMIRRNAEILSKDQRRWMTQVRNASLLIILIGLILIWSSEIQNFALSLTAFAVALVIATKEMILCFVGSMFRFSSNLYKLGDWVTIDGKTGEVMDINAFSTRIEEIDSDNTFQFTGKSVLIPNSKLFTAQIENQNFMKGYICHTISVIVQYNDLDPSQIIAKMEEIITAATAQYKDEAVKFTKRIARKTGIDVPDIKPNLRLKTTELGHYVMSARVFIPPREAAEISSKVTREMLAYIYNLRKQGEQNA